MNHLDNQEGRDYIRRSFERSDRAIESQRELRVTVDVANLAATKRMLAAADQTIIRLAQRVEMLEDANTHLQGMLRQRTQERNQLQADLRLNEQQVADLHGTLGQIQRLSVYGRGL
jgi:hypothetical protein